MLASDTQAIADLLKEAMIGKYQLAPANVEQHFADTRDTLCYATHDNQTAVNGYAGNRCRPRHRCRRI